MSDLRKLMTVAHAFAEGRGVKLSTVSSLALGDGKKLAAIEAGADITTRRLASALQFFSDNWPEDRDWPVDVPRPPRLSGQATGQVAAE